MDRSQTESQKLSPKPEEVNDVNDCPVEQVRLTVPTTDDPTLPCLTFRTWCLGIISCGVLAFLNQFFGYRQNALSVSSVIAQILVLPAGKIMAASLPTKRFRIRWIGWSFSLNPGPFNMKEHVLITILANAGSSSVYAVGIITIVKAFYHTEIHPMAAMLLTQSTQLLGFGWAGLFRKFLVDSPYMWWPASLVQVSLFRALHEEEKRPKGGLSRVQFFTIVLISSFAYYIVPNYLFQSITALSFVCWIWKDSFKAQQIGSGLKGFGIGAFSLDWATVAGFLGSPLATPGFAMMNMLVGYVIIFYVVVPISYWNNWYEARRFPMYAFKTYHADGTKYNVSKVLNQTTFSFNQAGYDEYGKVNLSILFVLAYGLSFATLAATVSHVILFYGRTILEQTKASIRTNFGDVHTRLMKKNYEAVPEWWFHSLLIVVIGLALLTCEGFGRQLQLPYWGIMLAIALASIFTLPIGVIVATTNQGVGLNVITELIIGYLYPGRPLANVVFKTYGDNSMRQALQFLSDFKLGHYMKIPPKSMFIVQLVGTIIASTIYFATSWWLLTTIEFICDPANLPTGSPWTCPGDDVFYNASIIWGLVGPQRMFGNLGLYSKMNYFFLFGILAPVPFWLLSRKYPEWKWVRLVNIPILINCPGPPAKAVNYNMWFAVGMFFNFVVYKKFKSWWARHNYILSAGLDAGVAFMAILCYLVLQNRNINGPEWWGLEVDDHCPLANCPSVPGIKVPGCPKIQKKDVEQTKNFGGKQKMSSVSAAAAFESDDDGSSSSEEEEEVKKEIWKQHYSSAHKILLVGEGDFSFSLCLARAFGSARNIVATTVDTQQELVKKYSNAVENLRELEDRGSVVLCGVDATAMSHHFFLTTQRFHRIVYNFPHVGFRFPEGNGCQIKLNKQLVKGFLKNAKTLLKKENGEIHVTHKVGEPYDRWDLVKKADKIGLVLHEASPFFKNRYPGYSQKRAHGASADAAFKLGESFTFKFRVSECG